MNRFRVSGGNEDLLRPRPNARAAIVHQMAAHDGWYWRKTRGVIKGPLHGPMSRAEAMQAFDHWGLKMSGFAIGRKVGGKFVPRVKATVETVKMIDLPNSSPGTDLVWSLIKHQFPAILYGGAYVYKEDDWGWSDHAWGTAVDPTSHPPTAPNDEVFSWLVSMAIAGCVEFDYVIGSRSGSVVSASKDNGYAVIQGGGDSSHLWHCHCSVVDHHGAKPPHPGGAW